MTLQVAAYFDFSNVLAALCNHAYFVYDSPLLSSEPCGTVDFPLPNIMGVSTRPQFRGHFALQIRPRNVPKGDFESLNRSLPTSQNLKASIVAN